MRINVITLLILSICLFPVHAYAYIDPGTGSLILQSIAAAVLGGLFTIKLYWQRLKTFFGFKPRSNDESQK